MQFEDISTHPIISYLQEETNTFHATNSFQRAADSDKVSSQSPFHQTKQLPYNYPHHHQFHKNLFLYKHPVNYKPECNILPKETERSENEMQKGNSFSQKET